MSKHIRIRTIATVAAVAALSITSVASAASVRGQNITVAKHFHAGPTVMAISAFPTGGKGSGTEATCSLWSGQLNMEQGMIDAATEQNDLGAYQDAKAAQEDDIDNALDAGCVVIY